MTRIAFAALWLGTTAFVHLRAEPLVIRPGVWETVSQSTHSGKLQPSKSKIPPVCINDAGVLAGKESGKILDGRMFAGSYAKHWVIDTQAGIGRHSAYIYGRRSSMDMPWMSGVPSSTKNLIQISVTLRGDFDHRLELVSRTFSGDISAKGIEPSLTNHDEAIVERVGDCPPGTSAEPIVPLPAPKTPPTP
jgi:hypothetical protein